MTDVKFGEQLRRESEQYASDCTAMDTMTREEEAAMSYRDGYMQALRDVKSTIESVLK